MDGVTAVREIRREEASRGRARIPIIMLTANVLPEHLAAGVRAGADGHLAKPLNVQALFAAIDAAADVCSENPTIRSSVGTCAETCPAPSMTAPM